MDKSKMLSYKEILIKEKEKVKSILNELKSTEMLDSSSEISQELSFYDNHPSDSATELFDKEKGIALKRSEDNILYKIDKSLENIENGTYGNCARCGVEISEERLNFIPYTQYCVKCKKELNSSKMEEKVRPINEKRYDRPFNYEYVSSKKSAEFDGKDVYKTLENFNEMKKVYDYGDYEYENEDDVGFVEDVEKISNVQYKNQLPD